jgi:hypothetical protein
MKKIVSLIVFAVALIWTWNIIHNSQPIGFETHSGIQQKLAELIKQTIASKKPNAKDLQVTRLWTEPMTDNKVRAVFAYKFTEAADGEEATEQSIEGEAILHREASDSTDVDNWTLQEVKTTNDVLIFSEGSKITPQTDTTTVETPTDAATPAPSATPDASETKE